MYIFLITGILCFIVMIVCVLLTIKKKVFYMLLRCIITIGLVIGIFAPLNGFEEPVSLVKEIRIMPIDENTYFTKLSSNSFMYWVRESPMIKEEDGKEIQKLKKKVITGNISVIYDKNCQTPVLRVYEGKGKASEFSYAFLAKTNRYEFIIPDTKNNN